MLEIVAAVIAGAVVGRRGVAQTARDALGLTKGVVNTALGLAGSATSTALGLAEGAVDRLERLAKAAADQAATATDRAKARAELARLLRENPELAAALAEAAKKDGEQA